MREWRKFFGGVAVSALICAIPAGIALAEVPYFQHSVHSKLLPPMVERLPKNPLVVTPGKDQVVGKYGGKLRTLVGSPADVKLMFVNGYARLISSPPSR